MRTAHPGWKPAWPGEAVGGRYWVGLAMAPCRAFAAGRIAVAAWFRAACARQQFDLYHEPNFIPLPSDVRTVVTICDLSVLLHPEWHPTDRVAYFERHFHKGLDRCVHFLAISEWGRQEIISTLGIRPESRDADLHGHPPRPWGHAV